MSLKELRGQLDHLDDELIGVLARRAAVVREIWAWKQANGFERTDPSRETELRARVLALAETLGLDRIAISAVLDQIVGRQLSR